MMRCRVLGSALIGVACAAACGSSGATPGVDAGAGGHGPLSCAADEYWDPFASVCRPGCDNDADCTAPDQGRCSPESHTCVSCLADDDCEAGFACAPATHACAERVRVATYNILGSHFTAAGSPICLDMTGAACTELRARNTMRVIRGQAGFDPFDIVGVQEMERDQFILLGKGLSGVDPAYADEPLKYDRVPHVVNQDPAIDDAQRTIYWRRDRFDEVASGTLSYPTNDGTNVGVSRAAYAPWVELRSLTTGKRFYVLNHHAAVTTVNQYRSTRSALFREQTAHIVSDWAASIQDTEHLPVVILGDFNSTFSLRNVPPHDDDIIYGNDRARLPYCVMTASGVLRHAEDAASGRTGPCPSPTGPSVDHIYTTLDWDVVGLVRVPKPPLATSPPDEPIVHASDHGPVYADLGL